MAPTMFPLPWGGQECGSSEVQLNTPSWPASHHGSFSKEPRRRLWEPTDFYSRSESGPGLSIPDSAQP